MILLAAFPIPSQICISLKRRLIILHFFLSSLFPGKQCLFMFFMELLLFSFVCQPLALEKFRKETMGGSGLSTGLGNAFCLGCSGGCSSKGIISYSGSESGDGVFWCIDVSNSISPFISSACCSSHSRMALLFWSQTSLRSCLDNGSPKASFICNVPVSLSRLSLTSDSASCRNFSLSSRRYSLSSLCCALAEYAVVPNRRRFSAYTKARCRVCLC